MLRASSSWRAVGSVVAWPVTAKNTSSRSGVWIDRCSNVDAGVVQLVEHTAQRGDAAVAGDLHKSADRRAGWRSGSCRLPRAARRSGELELDVPAGDSALQFGGGAFGDESARDPAPRHSRPAGRPRRGYWVVRKIGHAVGDQFPDDLPHGAAACAGRARWLGSSRKITDGLPTSVIARSSLRRIPPE